MKLCRAAYQSGLFIALLALAGQAGASCSLAWGYHDITNSYVNVSGSYTVVRNAPVGTVIQEFNWSVPFGNIYANCNNASSSEGHMDYFQPPFPLIGNGIYQTNIPGVGVQVMDSYQQRALPTTYSFRNTNLKYASPQLRYRLLVTGPVGTGNINSMTALPGVRWTLNGYGLEAYRTQASGIVSIVAATCTTSNVSVNLGQRSSSDFQGVGKPMKPAAVPFKINLNNCPYGLKSIQYQLDATTPVVAASSGVVALDGASTASGIGVQIRDSYSNPIRFGTKYNVPGGVSCGGDSYTVPLQATYYQTGNLIKGGTANTAVTFTLTYM